jgi:serine protease
MIHRVGVRLAPKGAAAAAVLCACGALIAGQVGSAQQEGAADRGAPMPYDLLMTGEQVDAIRRAWNDRLPHVPGEVLMKFRTGVEAAGRVRALAAVRAGVEAGNARWIGDTLWVRASGEPDAELLAAALRRQPEVEWAQPNHLYWTSATPNDPLYNRQWNFDLIDMPRAWDINTGGNEAITIAVADTGITTTTTSFEFPIWTGAHIDAVSVPFRMSPEINAARLDQGRDFVFWTGPVLDMVGHGTHVASTALQETNNSLALAGIAYRARLMPLKACFGYWEIQIVQSSRGIPGYVDPRDEGGCPNSAIAQAIRHAADNGAHVLNISFGGPGASPATLDALRYAIGRGIFVSMAAGNEFDSGNPTEYPAAYGPELGGAMAVGAVGRGSRRAFYSSTGSHLEISAPGGDFRDGGLSGVIYQTSLDEDDLDPFTIIRPRFDRYTDVPKQGTSMAAPHVAGVAALLRAQGISTPEAIEAALRRFARDLGATGRDDEFGHGLVDARTTLRGLGAAR